MNSRWLVDQGDILQQVEVLAYPFVQVVGFHPQPFGLIVTGELIFPQHQFIGTDPDGILRVEPDVALHALVVDKGAVGAAQVSHVIAPAHPCHLRMEA